MKLDDLRRGGKAALSQALGEIERAGEAPAVLDLLSQAYNAREAALAHVIGLTGPPGVGKSTLAGALISALRARSRRVGVIAVDPSSSVSGGALLGDRTRLLTDPDDAGVYVRSMAARDRLGGLAALTKPCVILMRALFDVVLVETVGVGQSEIEIAQATDTVVFCVQPGSGDSLQFMKAGIVEIPDVVVVTKSDLGALARAAEADIRSALKIAGAPGRDAGRDAGRDEWAVPVLSLCAPQKKGLEELIAALDSHFAWLQSEERLAARRGAQDIAWLEESLRERFGREGLKRAGALSLSPGLSPFDKLKELLGRLGG